MADKQDADNANSAHTTKSVTFETRWASFPASEPMEILVNDERHQNIYKAVHVLYERVNQLQEQVNDLLLKAQKPSAGHMEAQQGPTSKENK